MRHASLLHSEIGNRLCPPGYRLRRLLRRLDPQRSSAKSGVQITRLADRLRVEINGQLFTEYFYKDVPRPYCYPLIGPGDVAMTRNWPMKDTPGEEHDHPHHRSLWFAHGAINGHDFWSEQKAFGKTVHEDFLEVKSGNESGRDPASGTNGSRRTALWFARMNARCDSTIRAVPASG